MLRRREGSGDRGAADEENASMIFAVLNCSPGPLDA